MKTIWKFPLVVEDRQWVELPQGARILTVARQGDSLQLWALLDNKVKAVNRVEILIVGTGHPVPDGYEVTGMVDGEIISGQYEYISTFQMEAGQLVFHVFRGPVR